MKDLLLDDTGDLAINSAINDLVTTTDDKTLLKQQVDSLLNTNLGELSWNDNYGINMTNLMAHYDDIDALRQIIDEYLRDNLPNYAGISIDSSNFNNSLRQLYVVATVTMDNGIQATAEIGGNY